MRTLQHFARRALGMACVGLGVWLVVAGAAAQSDLAQVTGALLGVWSAAGGAALFLRGAPSARGARERTSPRAAHAADLVVRSRRARVAGAIPCGDLDPQATTA